MDNPKIKISIEGPFDKTKRSSDDKTHGISVYYSEQPKYKLKSGLPIFGQSKTLPGNPTAATKNASGIIAEDFTGQDIMSKQADNQWFHVALEWDGRETVYNMPAESFSNMIIHIPFLISLGRELGLWDDTKGTVEIAISNP